jgi:hypothetical protein
MRHQPPLPSASFICLTASWWLRIRCTAVVLMADGAAVGCVWLTAEHLTVCAVIGCLNVGGTRTPKVQLAVTCWTWDNHK